VIQPEHRRLSSALAGYQQPDTRRSVWELAATLGPLAVLWGGAYASAAQGWWWGLALVAPAALFLVRLFMIQHDCGHQAFFRSKAANTWTGRLIGVLTMTPYEYWRRTHAIHHATSGNLDRRGLGAIEMLTVEEYRALPWRKRIAYRIYRHPATLLGLGPTYMFVLQHRLPIGVMRERWAWMSVLGNNLGLLLLASVLIAAVGPRAFLLAHLPVVVLAATVGVWLFYVQHQFEETSWNHAGDWSLHEAALHGSSHYDLPPLLRWFTANIGIHHVHHLCSRVPFYRLTRILKEYPELGDIGRLTFIESIRCVRLVLWDENSRRLISFREVARAVPA
jgi:acyl-lipid omega-6 desaturase (Delta-12 desaturase)